MISRSQNSPLRIPAGTRGDRDGAASGIQRLGPRFRRRDEDAVTPAAPPRSPSVPQPQPVIVAHLQRQLPRTDGLTDRTSVHGQKLNKKCETVTELVLLDGSDCHAAGHVASRPRVYEMETRNWPRWLISDAVRSKRGCRSTKSF